MKMNRTAPFLIAIMALLLSPVLVNAFAVANVFTGVRESAVSWGDYDGDGDMDFALIGSTGAVYVTKIYKNNGNSTFSPMDIAISGGGFIPGVANGDILWTDFNADGQLDLLVTGYTGSEAITKIYKNNGNDFFVESASFEGLYHSAVATADIDNDGDTDLILTGEYGVSAFSKIYKNDGNFSFSASTASFLSIKNGDIAVGDINKDGHIDIVLMGEAASGPVTKVYKNNGSGFFILIDDTLEAVQEGSIDLGDYDEDGDLDILLTGDTQNLSPTPYITKVYTNDGDGTYTLLNPTGVTLEGIRNGAAHWGDIDNDGDLDIVEAGENNSATYVANIYQNDGGIFSDPGETITGTSFGSVSWGDFDGDNDLDFLVTGALVAGNEAQLYENTTGIVNLAPSAPQNLTASWQGPRLWLNWDTATDDYTSINALTYEVRVGSRTGIMDVISGDALSIGLRTVASPGGIYKNSLLVRLPQEDYYWSVQAIDSAFVGSAWSAENFITVPAVVISEGGSGEFIMGESGAGFNSKGEFEGAYEDSLESIADWNDGEDSQVLTRENRYGNEQFAGYVSGRLATDEYAVVNDRYTSKKYLENMKPSAPKNLPPMNEVVAAMAVAKETVSIKSGGMLESADVKLEIPADVISGTSKVSVKMESFPAKYAKTVLPTEKGVSFVGDSIHEFTAKKANGVSARNFDKPMTVTLKYDPSDVSSLEDLAIHFWDGTEWMPLPNSSFDPETGVVTGTTTHFTVFALLKGVFDSSYFKHKSKYDPEATNYKDIAKRQKGYITRTKKDTQTAQATPPKTPSYRAMVTKYYQSEGAAVASATVVNRPGSYRGGRNYTAAQEHLNAREKLEEIRKENLDKLPQAKEVTTKIQRNPNSGGALNIKGIKLDEYLKNLQGSIMDISKWLKTSLADIADYLSTSLIEITHK